MSKTNKERLQDNNTALLRIKTKAQDLPDFGGDVKLFDTVEHMQADPKASEGDLAVVYREEIQPVTEESEFDSCVFPNTVVLDEAFTGNVYGRFRAVDHSVMFDGNVDMSSSNFRFNGWSEGGSINVQYTSSDGLTYTRTDEGEELVEFGTTIRYEGWGDPFNDVIGNFMKIGGNHFEGLYEYKAFKNKNKIHIYSYSELAWDNSTSKLTGTGGEVIEFDIKSTLNKITEYTETNFSDYRSGTYYGNPIYEYMLYYDNNCIVFPFATQNEETPYKFLHNLNLLIDNTTWKATGGIIVTDPSVTYNLHEIRVNITTGQLSYELLQENFTNETYQPLTRFNNYKFVGNINMDKIFNYEYQNNLTTILYYSTKDSTWYLSNCIYGEKSGVADIKYLLADNQFNLKSSNELLLGKIAYGKNGVITGDGSIYDNLDWKSILNKLEIPDKYSIYSSNSSSISNKCNYLPITFNFKQDLIDSINNYYGSDLVYYLDDTKRGDPVGNMLIGEKYVYLISLVSQSTGSSYKQYLTVLDKNTLEVVKSINVSDTNTVPDFMVNNNETRALITYCKNSSNYCYQYKTLVNLETSETIVKDVAMLQSKDSVSSTQILYNNSINKFICYSGDLSTFVAVDENTGSHSSIYYGATMTNNPFLFIYDEYLYVFSADKIGKYKLDTGEVYSQPVYEKNVTVSNIRFGKGTFYDARNVGICFIGSKAVSLKYPNRNTTGKFFLIFNDFENDVITETELNIPEYSNGSIYTEYDSVNNKAIFTLYASNNNNVLNLIKVIYDFNNNTYTASEDTADKGLNIYATTGSEPVHYLHGANAGMYWTSTLTKMVKGLSVVSNSDNCIYMINIENDIHYLKNYTNNG